MRFSVQSGIAIGPILFIIAVLGLLAAAIAAGSGSFSSGTSNESATTLAQTILYQAHNYKDQIDILYGRGYDQVYFGTQAPSTNGTIYLGSNTSQTGQTIGLFYQNGANGAVILPVPKNALISPYPWGTANWEEDYARIQINGTDIGTATADEALKIGGLTQPVCAQINKFVSGSTAINSCTDLSDGSCVGPYLDTNTMTIASMGSFCGGGETIPAQEVCCLRGGSAYFYWLVVKGR